MVFGTICSIIWIKVTSLTLISPRNNNLNDTFLQQYYDTVTLWYLHCLIILHHQVTANFIEFLLLKCDISTTVIGHCSIIEYVLHNKSTSSGHCIFHPVFMLLKCNISTTLVWHRNIMVSVLCNESTWWAERSFRLVIF